MNFRLVHRVTIALWSAIVLFSSPCWSNEASHFFFPFYLVEAVNKHLANNRGKIEMLCSKIRCPAESNPSWRWYGLWMLTIPFFMRLSYDGKVMYIVKFDCVYSFSGITINPGRTLLRRAPRWSAWKKSRPAKASLSYFLMLSVPAGQNFRYCHWMMLRSLGCSSGKESPWLNINIALSLLKWDGPNTGTTHICHACNSFKCWCL